MTILPDQRYGIPSGSHSIIGGTLVSINARPAGRLHLDPYSFDAEYLRRLREGDPVITEHFIAYFTARLRVKVWKQRCGESDGDDIIQETFRRVLETVQKPDGIRSPERFGAFVSRVCDNCLMERHRRNLKTDQLDDDCLNIPALDPSLEQLLISGEEAEEVRRTLELMRPDERQLLVDVIANKRPKDEVCAECRITRANLRVKLHRAIGRFRFLHSQGKGKPPQRGK